MFGTSRITPQIRKFAGLRISVWYARALGAYNYQAPAPGMRLHPASSRFGMKVA